ncbi:MULTISPECIES: thermonuclease family protein [unclassified Tardiphaga]|uniref:thermonuclease family protein n=1 Tax=unclassified Tardiphaga TaxID=2631404 RepID=UPI001AEF19EF
MRVSRAMVAAILGLAATGPAHATGCRFAPQGEGRVAEVIDVRTFRLQDGREVRLLGIEPADTTDAAAALAGLIAGRSVTLHGETDAPDRYGRQPAFAFLDGATPSVQSELLAQGTALASLAVSDKDCAADLTAAEAAARRARVGLWGQAGVIKSAESPGDILADVGRFRLVEGRVLSVRTAGGMTYLNFGRNWTQDFAVTISRRMMVTLEGAGISPKSFERRRIRVRGFIERRGGPRIEVVRVGQIEVVGDK